MPYKKQENNFTHDSINFDGAGNLIWTRPELECLWTKYRQNKVAVFNWFKDAIINGDKIIVDNACKKDWIVQHYLQYLNIGDKKYNVMVEERFY